MNARIINAPKRLYRWFKYFESEYRPKIKVYPSNKRSVSNMPKKPKTIL